MKFIYTGGDLQYFRGLEFFSGVPVDVEDKGTIDELKKRDDFMEVVETSPVEVAPVATSNPSDPKACPKCGKVIGRGRVMHVKYCKG